MVPSLPHNLHVRYNMEHCLVSHFMTSGMQKVASTAMADPDQEVREGPTLKRFFALLWFLTSVLSWAPSLNWRLHRTVQELRSFADNG